jgi:hypothetical protein
MQGLSVLSFAPGLWSRQEEQACLVLLGNSCSRNEKIDEEHNNTIFVCVITNWRHNNLQNVKVNLFFDLVTSPSEACEAQKSY